MNTNAVQNLTLGEIAAVENLSGQPITAMADDDSPKGKAMAAMAYVIKRRTNPDFKFEDAMKMTMQEANEAMGFAEAEPDPTE